MTCSFFARGFVSTCNEINEQEDTLYAFSVDLSHAEMKLNSQCRCSPAEEIRLHPFDMLCYCRFGLLLVKLHS